MPSQLKRQLPRPSSRIFKLSTRQTTHPRSSFSLPELQRLWVTLNEIPLALLSAIAAAIGNVVLFQYFKNTGYTPDDTSAWLALGLAISFASLLVTICLGILGLLPAIAVHFLKLQVSKNHMLLLQSIAVAAMGGYLFPAFNLLSGAIAGVALHKVVDTILSQSAVPSKQVGAVIAVPFFTMFLLLSGLSITIFSEDTAAPGWIGLLVLTIATVPLMFINAAVVAEKNVVGGLIVVVILIPTILNQFAPNGTFPKWAATAFGVRIAGVSDLMVSKGTCDLINAASTLRSANTETVRCIESGNHLKADVRVRVGKTWLVCVRTLNGVPIEPVFSLTIPAAGTEQMIQKNAIKAIPSALTKVEESVCG